MHLPLWDRVPEPEAPRTLKTTALESSPAREGGGARVGVGRQATVRLEFLDITEGRSRLDEVRQ